MIEAEKEEVKVDFVSKGSITLENGYGFYKFIEALSNISEEVPLDFDPINKVLKVPVIDPLRICLIGIKIRGYEIHGDVSGKRVYINLKDLKKLLKTKKEAKKSVKLIFGDAKKLWIEKYNGNLGTIKKSLVYLNMELEDMPIDNLEAIEFPNTVVINKKLLSDMFYESGNYSDIVQIETNDRGIYFREEGVMGEYEAFYESDKLKECDCDGLEKSYYSYTYLNLIKNFLNIMDKSDVVNFSQKIDHPLKIVIDLKSIDNTKVKYYIAPRVEEPKWDDDDEFL